MQLNQVSNFYIFLLSILTFALFAAELKAQDYDLFDDSYIHNVHIKNNKSDLVEVMRNNYRTRIKTYQTAHLEIDDQSYDSIGIREKGNHSNQFAWTAKKPYKIKADHKKNQTIQGVQLLAFSNCFEDPSYLRDILSYRLLRQMNIPVPRSCLAKVFINDTLMGIYTMTEYIDSSFVSRHFNCEGALYEGESASFDTLDKNNKKAFNRKYGDENRILLNRLLDLLNNDKLSFEELSSLINVESIIKSAAVDLFIWNKDAFTMGRTHNYYVFIPKDFLNQKAEYIPWDYNLSFGYEYKNHTSFTQPHEWNSHLQLLVKLFSFEESQKLYEKALNDVYDLLNRKNIKWIKNQHKMLEPHLINMPRTFYDYSVFEKSLTENLNGDMAINIPGILIFIKMRKKHLKTYLSKQQNH